MIECMLMAVAPVAPKPDNTLALLRAKDGFKELCYNRTITKVNTPAVDTTIKKFGTSSFKCNTGYIEVGELTDFIFTKDAEFTIEQWQYTTGFGSNCWFFAKGGNTNSCLKTASDSNLYLQTEGASVSAAASSVLTPNVWQHVAIVQYAGVLKVYVNGVAKMTLTANANFGSSSARLSFGGGSLLKITCNGYVDQLRVSKIARYKANFTPPTDIFVID